VTDEILPGVGQRGEEPTGRADLDRAQPLLQSIGRAGQLVDQMHPAGRSGAGRVVQRRLHLARGGLAEPARVIGGGGQVAHGFDLVVEDRNMRKRREPDARVSALRGAVQVGGGRRRDRCQSTVFVDRREVEGRQTVLAALDVTADA
jgi:hypothetical protein